MIGSLASGGSYCTRCKLLLRRPSTDTPYWQCHPCAGAVPRIFAAATCGHEHVAAEALRLLTRLWAPASARSGQGPWVLPRSGPNEAGKDNSAFDASSSLPLGPAQDLIAFGRQAKSICLAPSGRCGAPETCCPGASPATKRPSASFQRNEWHL